MAVGGAGSGANAWTVGINGSSSVTRALGSSADAEVADKATAAVNKPKRRNVPHHMTVLVTGPNSPSTRRRRPPTGDGPREEDRSGMSFMIRHRTPGVGRSEALRLSSPLHGVEAFIIRR
jgi:hypothetical protein